MKSHKYFFGLLLGTLLLFPACEEEFYDLDQQPIDAPSSATFLSNIDELGLAVVGAYRILWEDENFNMPHEIFFDNVSDIAWTRNWRDQSNWQIVTTDSEVTSTYLDWYKGIQRTNFILANADRVSDADSDEDLYNQLLSEAKFLRAYLYHHLIGLYGDVPLITAPIEENFTDFVGRTDKEVIYDLILDDLEDASAFLPERNANASRASRDAALGLKARIALYAGRYDVAIDAASRVIDAGTHSIDADFEGLFRSDRQGSSNEIIFKIPYLIGTQVLNLRGLNTRNGRGFSTVYPVQAMIDSYLCTDGLPIDESPLYDTNNPFENRDPRLDFTCVRSGTTFYNIQYETHLDSVECTDFNTGERINNRDVTNPFRSRSGYTWRKYTWIPDFLERNTLVTLSENAFVLIRYAEVLLTYAEAKIEANDIDQSVYDAINQLRTRASVNMPVVTAGKSQAELRTIVRVERKCEMALEGLRLFDIRRWGIAEQVLTGPVYGRVPDGNFAAPPEIDENGTPDYSNVPNFNDIGIVSQRAYLPRFNLWPIPQIEIEVNPEMTQNEGY